MPQNDYPTVIGDNWSQTEEEYTLVKARSKPQRIQARLCNEVLAVWCFFMTRIIFSLRDLKYLTENNYISLSLFVYFLWFVQFIFNNGKNKLPESCRNLFNLSRLVWKSYMWVHQDTLTVPWERWLQLWQPPSNFLLQRVC